MIIKGLPQNVIIDNKNQIFLHIIENHKIIPLFKGCVDILPNIDYKDAQELYEIAYFNKNNFWNPRPI
jgi:hypothetical protein